MLTRFIVLFMAIALTAFAWMPVSSAQISIIPGSSVQGTALFRTKGCIDCHAFEGTGGKVAPDLAQRNERVRTPMQLASALWNHAPRMWRAQQDRPNQARALLDSMETADLFAYFYSLSYSKVDGNADRGARLFNEKGCAACHETTARPPAAGPIERGLKNRASMQLPVSTWTIADDPMAWAERMWNHSGKVYAEMSAAGLDWPLFSAEDMVDLLTYIRSLPEARSQSAAFQPGNPELGRITFERSCESCHSFGSGTVTPKVDLLTRRAPQTLTAYVAAMWNHAPAMHSRAGSQFPVLGRGDMGNLVAYLFAQRYFDEQGDVQRGARVFENKNCSVCHERQRRQTGAPDLTQVTERYSPITISAAVWRHGPSMLKAVEGQKSTWPELNATEMLDLLTFLNSRLVPRIARPN